MPGGAWYKVYDYALPVARPSPGVADAIQDINERLVFVLQRASNTAVPRLHGDPLKVPLAISS
jgi:hypothetical protein